MIDLLIYLLVFVVVASLVWWVITQLPLPEPIGRMVRIIVVVIMALVLIMMLLGMVGQGPPLRWR